MIEKAKQYLEEYGWVCKFADDSNQNSLITYYTPSKEQNYKILIVISESENTLFFSSHKLFKFNQSDRDLISRFLKFNTSATFVKWFTRDIDNDEVFVNLGFEIGEKWFSKEILFEYIDSFCFYIDDVIELLKEKNLLTEANFTVQEKFEKNSFELIL